MTITEYLGAKPKSVLMPLGFLLLVVVSSADYVLHANHMLELSAFYLIPVSFFSWFIGKRSGIALSIASVVIDFAIRLKSLPQAIVYWDELVWFSLYITSTLMIVQLNTLYERERRLSRIDPLTMAENRRGFLESAERAKSFSDRYHMPLSIAYLDLDNFKQFNDRLGHITGDKLLVVVAEGIRKALRPTDAVGRIGGDEFAVLLPGTDKEPAARIVGRVRQELDQAMRERYWSMTFSIGLVSFTPPIDSVLEMMQAADETMYAAKNQGKNRLEHRQFAVK